MDGGPVATERGFLLHSPYDAFDHSITVSEDIQLTLSRDVLESMAAGSGPESSLIALGYAGWEAGQLEVEMIAMAPFHSDLAIRFVQFPLSEFRLRLLGL